jgi:glycerol-3-phosphate acyltransferase PlsY
MPEVRELLFVIGAYAAGCISTGYYLVLLQTGRDIRQLGSGSTGARNVGRILGKPGFVATLAGDTAKGAAALGFATFAGLSDWGLIAVIVAVFAGHVWPMQLRFKGGKGLATVMGAVLVLDYWLVIVAFLVAAVVLEMSKRFTLSGLVAVALTPVVAVVADRSSVDIVIGLAVLAALIMVAHHQNIISGMPNQAWRR